MLHVLLLRYTQTPDDAAPHVPDHVEYLETHHDDGTFVLSGQTAPDDVGGVILARGSRTAVERIAATDPFIVAGVGAYEIISVDPGQGARELLDLFGP